LSKTTIITATYNTADTLAACLDSVKNQCVDVEHILVDGGSTDATLDIAESHKESIAKIVSEPDRGIYDAMNKGLEMASGDIIGILNADDYYSSGDVLSGVMQAFKNPNVQACYGDLVYVDTADSDKVIRYWVAGKYDPKKFYHGWMPPHPTFFVRTSVYEKYGLFNLNLGSAADYEIMLRFLLKHKVCIEYLPMVMVYMRTGGASNATIFNRMAANRMDREAWIVNDLKPYPWTLHAKPLRKLGQWWWPKKRLKRRRLFGARE
jgi:glycosyltransferase involved in cell wall biosynthesis